MKTNSKTVAADVAALLRARNPLIWITTREEARVEGYLFEAAASVSYEARTWDVATGLKTFAGRKLGELTTDPGEALKAIMESQERCVWIMRDLAPWLQGPVGMTTLRLLRNAARELPSKPRDKANAIIVLSAGAEVPPELQAHATVIEWPLPTREEMGELLDAAVAALPDEIRASAMPNGTRDEAVGAAIGLTGEEAQACFAKSLVKLRRIDPAVIAAEKKGVITRERTLEWYDPLPGGLDAVGGLEALKAWLQARALAYSPEARAYGLPAPKGALLAGVPGCGKSMTAKAIATAWGVPLLKLDLGSLKSKFVGESEANLRKAFKTIEAIGRCVVWIDECEKALQGATSGSADGGVSSDALGAILNWMQERTSEAFVLATANDAEALPPELLRKGRFDEVFWVDLPTGKERLQILQATLATFGRAEHDIDVISVGGACEGFTGSEIAALVPEAMFAAFADGKREIKTRDLLTVAATTTPLIKTAAAKLERLRAWSVGKARPATTEAPVALPKDTGRKLDF